MICTRCRREIPEDAALCCYCGRVFQKKKPFYPDVRFEKSY